MQFWRSSSARTGQKPRELVARRHRPDYQIVLFMGILVLVGLIVIYSISPAMVEQINTNAGSTLNTNHFMQRQVLNLLVGLAVFVVAAFLPVQYWKKYAWQLLLAGLIACGLLALLGLVMSGGIILKTGGAVRWFNLGITTFQPAELLKFGFIIYTATFLANQIRKGKLNDMTATFVPLGILLALAGLFVIVFQKDMGTGITLIGAVVVMLFAAGIDRRWMTIGVSLLVAVGILLTITSPHRMERILTFLQASDATDASSYHINQAMIALGSGGLLGKGLGQGVQAFGYLPEAVNDSIFAILGETFGFVGLMVILALFGALLRRLLLTAERTVDVADRLLVVGIFGVIASHIIVNIGAMTGIFPLTGVTLPFLSFGGTSLMFTMLGLGIVFYISRFTVHQRVTEKEGAHEATVRRRGVGRTRYAGSRRYQ